MSVFVPPSKTWWNNYVIHEVKKRYISDTPLPSSKSNASYKRILQVMINSKPVLRRGSIRRSAAVIRIYPPGMIPSKIVFV